MAMQDSPVGQPAPEFRLATADSREIALSDCVAQGPVVVRFSRGLGCPVCRRHRAHLTLGYSGFRGLGAEILEVTPTEADRAAFYFSNYSLAFPYLCDPSREIARAYGVEHHPPTAFDTAKVLVSDLLSAPELLREARLGPNPVPDEKAGWSNEDGFFVIDRSGTIRVARVGQMVGVPSNAEIERTLRELGD